MRIVKAFFHYIIERTHTLTYGVGMERIIKLRCFVKMGGHTVGNWIATYILGGVHSCSCKWVTNYFLPIGLPYVKKIQMHCGWWSLLTCPSHCKRLTVLAPVSMGWQYWEQLLMAFSIFCIGVYVKWMLVTTSELNCFLANFEAFFNY